MEKTQLWSHIQYTHGKSIGKIYALKTLNQFTAVKSYKPVPEIENYLIILFFYPDRRSIMFHLWNGILVSAAKFSNFLGRDAFWGQQRNFSTFYGKKSRLKSTFLPYHVKKHHSTLEMDTFKIMLLLSYLASLDNKPHT